MSVSQIAHEQAAGVRPEAPPAFHLLAKPKKWKRCHGTAIERHLQ